MLKKSIADNLISAIKNKHNRAVSILRLLNAEIKNQEIDLKRELNENEIISIIRREIKKLQDALELFKKGNRPDLVSENEEQIQILMTYVPAEMNDEELVKEIERIKKQHQEEIIKNPKSLIGFCMKELRSRVSPHRILAILSSINSHNNKQ